MGRSFYSLMLVLTLLVLPALPPPAGRPAEGAILPGSSTASAGIPGPAGPAIVESDARHIVLEWTAPPYRVAQDTLDGRPVQRATVEGCPPSGAPGEPELPRCTAVLGIPPDAALALRIVEVESLSLGTGYHLPPLPGLAIEPDLLAELGVALPTVRERRVEGPAYAHDDFFPAQPAALGGAAFMRHQRMVVVSFFPLQYRPQSGELVYHPRARIEIAFGERREPMGPVAEPAAFERLLRDTLLNYDQARAWRRMQAQPLELPPAPPSPGWRIPVNQEGLYKLTYERLQAAGLPVDTLDPRTLRLYRYGQEVAIRVIGEEDGHLDPADYVLFYGLPLADNRYTATEVYWLTYGGETGRRMPTRDGTPRGATVPVSFPVTEHLEENHLYFSKFPWRPDHDHWFWNYTFPPSIPQQSYLFPSHSLAQEPYSATLRFHGQSYTSFADVNPDHHLRAWVNGTLVGETWWDGQVEITLTYTFPSTLLQPAGNTVRIECPGDTGALGEINFHDWVELEERRLFVAEGDRLAWVGQVGTWEYHLGGFSRPNIFLFDLGDPDFPVEIVSATVVPISATYELRFQDSRTQTTAYLALAEGQVREPATIEAAAPADLRNPANGADYILITHVDFYTQALSLAAFRNSQGRRTIVVDVADVYDLFGYGRRVPEAVHDALAYAYENWIPPAPSAVVLLGDGHYDPKNYLGGTAREYILPYLEWVDPWLGETAADNRFVCLSGEDTLPDMLLGRLPVNSPTEAQAVVGKVLQYEGSPPPGDWRRWGLFVADDTDQAGNFSALSDALIRDYYPPPYQAQRVYLGVTCPYEWPSVACHDEIIAAINEGRLLINYIGHGGVNVWASEQLLKNTDPSLLSETPFLPVALPMSCYEGSYHDPTRPAVAEAFLRASGKGWIGSFSPTGLGVATGHHFLDEGFFQALFFDDERQLGPATMAGKLRLWQSNSSLYLLDTYLLLGDPALEMPLLETDLSLDKAAPALDVPLRPGDALTFTLALAAAGPATAHHIVLTDTLSPYIVSPTVRAEGLTLTLRPGTRFVWDVADLPAGHSGRVTVTARLSWQAPAGPLLNQARVSTTAKETDTQNNADTISWLVIPGPPYAISLSADPPALPADGNSLSLLRAQVVDTAGNPVADGTAVTMTTDAGTFFDGSTIYYGQTFQGVVEVFLRAANRVVTATVIAVSGQASGQVQVPFVSMDPHTVLVEALPAAIPVTGTAQITATVLDVLGHPVRDGTAVTFTTSLGAVTPTVAATAAGIAHSTLHGEGLSGLATILARSGNAAGTATVRIGSGSSFTLTLQADPPAIPADGQSRSTITATLVRADGQPITLTYWIYFSTTLGAIPSRSLAISGTTSIPLTAGTTAGTAWIVAHAQGASAATTVQLLPGEAATLVLSATPASVPVGGATSTLQALVRDAYGNAVADGTMVAFSTTLGTVDPPLAHTQNGAAYSWLTSGAQAGLATVLAHTGPASGTATVRFTALSPATLTLSANPAVIPADGASISTLSAWVADTYSNPVEDGTTVYFYTNLGYVRPGQAGTVGGWATAVLTGTQVGMATVQALAGGVGAQTTVSLVPGAPASILVTATPARLYASGVSTATITAYLWDSLGHPVADGMPVSFSTTRGSLAPTQAATQGGQAVATLRSSTEVGWATVQAASPPAVGQAAVEFYAFRVYLPLVWRGTP